MKAEDLAQVAVLATQLGYPAVANELAPRFEIISRSSASALFVAEDQNEVVGWIHVNREAQSLVSQARAEISSLVVDEKARGRQIGARLVAKAEDWAREHGISTVRLRSNINRERAHKFYQREGYAIRKSWHVFVKDL